MIGEPPPPVEAGLGEPLGAYWRDRIGQHFLDSYCGLPMLKLPEDLRMLEHLLWQSRADAVVELGVQGGGSTLWLRDRLVALARYRGSAAARVVGVDLDVSTAERNIAAIDPAFANTITLLAADLRAPDTPARVAGRLPPDVRCLVVEDSAHTYPTTWAALEGFSRFVPTGGYLVVEDGCVDVEELRLRDDWPRGVAAALDDWLATEAGRRFARVPAAYGVTCHVGGYLTRVG